VRPSSRWRARAPSKRCLCKKGAPLPLNFRSILPADPVAEQEIVNSSALSEQLVTICAASLALLVVAAIAALMGMA
jgi:hypothetical protein